MNYKRNIITFYYSNLMIKFRFLQQIKYYHLYLSNMFAKTNFKPSKNKIILAPERFSFPNEEENTLNYWKDIKAFQVQL